MNFLCKIFGGSYDDLWKAIIRPGRDTYEQEELGPFKFEINGKCYKRTDFEIINNRGLKLLCSFWEPFDEEREKVDLPCVIYLHGNSSSRCEAYGEIKYLLPKNICLFSFDFSGCGKSEGDYISLGHYEKDDVYCVIEYLLKSKKVSKIGLWGRSMGAVTAIMFTAEHPNLISALILDSGFYSLNILIHEIVNSKVSLPNFIIESILKKVKETIKEKAGFDLDEIEPYLYVKNCNVPAFFCHGKDDNFVFPHHCKDLYKDYKGYNKHLNLVKGNHNSSRPKEIKNKVSEFLVDYLKDDDYDSDETIINYNTFQKKNFNNNQLLDSFNNDYNIENNDSDNNFYNIFKQINNRQKYKSKDKNNNTLKKNFNDYMNNGSIEENNMKLNKNASQNMRAYSYNKYSKNDLKIINKKNTNNHINNLYINMIHINKNKFEENNNSKSNSSSSIIEQPSVYSKKSVQKETLINNRVRSMSVNNSDINKNKMNSSPFNNRKLNKSINKKLDLNVINKKNKTKKDLYTESINFMNRIIKDNIQTDKNFNRSGKTYSSNFFKKNSNDYSNSNQINNFFSINNNIYFNNHKPFEINNKKNEDKNNYNLYSSKRQPNKENVLFRRRRIQKNEIKNLNLNENNDLNSLNNKKNNPKEENKTIISENTILDENDEIMGRNIPH